MSLYNTNKVPILIVNHHQIVQNISDTIRLPVFYDSTLVSQ